MQSVKSREFRKMFHFCLTSSRPLIFLCFARRELPRDNLHDALVVRAVYSLSQCQNPWLKLPLFCTVWNDDMLVWKSLRFAAYPLLRDRVRSKIKRSCLSHKKSKVFWRFFKYLNSHGRTQVNSKRNRECRKLHWPYRWMLRKYR